MVFIAVDGWSNDLPSDVRELIGSGLTDQASYPAGQSGNLPGDADGLREVTLGAEPQTRLGASELDRWDIQSHQYTSRTAVQGSVLARLFSSRAEISSYGLVQEAKRFRIGSTEQGRRVEFGTAVRLSVVVMSNDLDISLTLPNIAAKAQISNVQAKVALSVDGYTGPLGELLPAPDNLNVENLELYTTAFKALQKEVYGPNGLEFLRPTLLGYDEMQSELA